MTKQDFQAELKEKVKEGIKPSQLKRSASTPVKSATKENMTNDIQRIIQLEDDKVLLLAINQEAVSQNEQLVKVIDQLKQEKEELVQEKSALEVSLIRKAFRIIKYSAY